MRAIDRSHTIRVITHENADADAVGSSVALQIILEDLGKHVEILAPGSVSKLGRFLAQGLGRSVRTTPSSKEADLLLFVDTQPGPGAGEGAAIIDHHEAPEGIRGDLALLDSSYPSAAEMIYELITHIMSEGRLEILPRDAAMALLCGIITDTSHLRLATSATLERILRICELGGLELVDAFSLLRTPRDPSLRMALLKAASRLRIRRTGEYVIVITEVTSFQGDVASSLLGLGADVAFAGGRKKVLNVSGRARHELVQRGFSLAQVMRTVAARIGGDGGGHAGAAALKGQGETIPVLEMCAREAKRAINALPTRAEDAGRTKLN
jgi:nanoRNase/pAp phosphatase (c-di-AMP/oligoRNAs hydrolase)